MYRQVEGNLRMTDNEACEHFPDDYIAMRMDSMFGDTGTVLYVGDDDDELFSLIVRLGEPFCGVIEGLNLRRSLGGVVVGG